MGKFRSIILPAMAEQVTRNGRVHPRNPTGRRYWPATAARQIPGPESGVGPGNRPNERPGGQAEIADLRAILTAAKTGANTARPGRGPGVDDRFYWFCLEHVREYNAAWNYYADMDDAAVEAEIRKDIVWQRPTWPLGTRLGRQRCPNFTTR